MDVVATQISAQKAKVEAELALLTKLEGACKALDELSQRQMTEVEEQADRHDEEVGALAKSLGYASLDALNAAITAARGKPSKVAQPKRSRAVLDDAKRQTIAAAYKNRKPGETARTVAMAHGVSENTVHKLASK